MKLTQHQLEQRTARQAKRKRKIALGLLLPSRKESLKSALSDIAKSGATRQQIEALVETSRYIWRNDSGVIHADYERMLDNVFLTPEKPPMCEECNEEMHRYGPALDTGKEGWQCDSCGWSWDDN